ncbi:MAG: nucleotidyltransferase family protein [Spirochaetaceae bacterium]
MDPELQKIVDAENRRNRAELERRERRLAEARHEARRLTEEIRKADPGVRKVILFGSVATGAVGSERFDIDLALLGGDQLKLMTITEESSFAVDLVDLEAVSTGFRQRVEERGEVLYDAQQ